MSNRRKPLVCTLSGVGASVDGLAGGLVVTGIVQALGLKRATRLPVEGNADR